MKIKRQSLYNFLIKFVVLLSLLAYEQHIHKYYSIIQICISFLIFILLLIYFKKDNEKKWLMKALKHEPLVISVSFLMIATTAMAFLTYKYNTLKSIISTVMFAFTSITMFFVIPFLCKKNEGFNKSLFEIYLKFCIVLSVFSIILNFFGGSFLGYNYVMYRNASFYYDPNFLATVLGVGFLMILMSDRKITKKIILLFLIFIAIYLTGSRGGLLSLVLAILIYLFIYSKQSLFRKIVFLVIVGVVSVIGLKYLLNNTNFFRLYQGDNYRTEMLTYAFKLVLDSPVIGYGYQSISACLKWIGGTAAVHASTHNSYMDFLFAYGFLTFGLYVLLIAKLLIKGIFRNKSELKLYIICTIFLLINANTILYSFGGVGILSIMYTVMLGMLNIRTLNKKMECDLDEI